MKHKSDRNKPIITKLLLIKLNKINKKIWSGKKSFLKQILYFIFIYSGIGYIIQMIHRPTESEYKKRKPSNFVIWAIGVYTAIFSIAFQKYENRVNRLINSFNAISQQINENVSTRFLQTLVDLQQRKVPYEPKIFNPYSVYLCLNEKYDIPYDDVVKDVGEIAQYYIEKMSKVEIMGLTINSSSNSINREYGTNGLLMSDLNKTFAMGSSNIPQLFFSNRNYNSGQALSMSNIGHLHLYYSKISNFGSIDNDIGSIVISNSKLNDSFGYGISIFSDSLKLSSLEIDNSYFENINFNYNINAYSRIKRSIFNDCTFVLNSKNRYLPDNCLFFNCRIISKSPDKEFLAENLFYSSFLYDSCNVRFNPIMSDEKSMPDSLSNFNGSTIVFEVRKNKNFLEEITHPQIFIDSLMESKQVNL